MKTPDASLSIAALVFPRTSGARLRLALGVIVPAALVWVAIRPKAGAHGGSTLPPARFHLPDWALIAHATPAIQIHLTGVTVALAIGIALLIGVKGDRLHRTLGWAWVLAMMTAAISSLFIRVVNQGALSYIHLISGWVILMLPAAVAFARTHRVRRHARAMTGLFTGGLLLAGALAFMPGRLMWNLFF